MKKINIQKYVNRFVFKKNTEMFFYYMTKEEAIKDLKRYGEAAQVETYRIKLEKVLKK